MRRLLLFLAPLALAAMLLPAGTSAQDVDVRVRVKHPRAAAPVYAPPPPVYAGTGCRGAGCYGTRPTYGAGCYGARQSAGCYGGSCYGRGAGCYGGGAVYAPVREPRRYATPIRDFLFGR